MLYFLKLLKAELTSGNIYDKAFLVVAVIFAAIALFEWGLTICCVVMMPLDSNPESNWNSGVSFYGGQAILLTMLTAVIVVVYKSLSRYRK